MIWRGHKDADDVYASKPFFAILTVFRCTALARSWSIKVGDIGTAFTNVLFKPPSDLYTIKEHLLEAEKGDAWSQVIAKNLARPSSKHRARNKLHTIHIRTQRAPTSRMSTNYLSQERSHQKCYCEQLVKISRNTQFHAWEEEPPTKEIISTSALMMSTWTTPSTKWWSRNGIVLRQQEQQ